MEVTVEFMLGYDPSKYMVGVLIKGKFRHRCTQRECHMKIIVEVMLIRSGLLADHQKLGKKVGPDSSPVPRKDPTLLVA